VVEEELLGQMHLQLLLVQVVQVVVELVEQMVETQEQQEQQILVVVEEELLELHLRI
jgi:hypothetical protein